MSIFIDTGIWIGYFNADDSHASRSTEIIEKIQKGLHGLAWTSTFVVDEMYTFLERETRDKELAIDATTIVLGKKEKLTPFTRIYPISSDDCLMALQLARKYQDKRMSFTDLSSLVICNKLKIEHMASYDKHFKGIIPVIQ